MVINIELVIHSKAISALITFVCLIRGLNSGVILFRGGLYAALPMLIVGLYVYIFLSENTYSATSI